MNIAPGIAAIAFSLLIFLLILAVALCTTIGNDCIDELQRIARGLHRSGRESSPAPALAEVIGVFWELAGGK